MTGMGRRRRISLAIAGVALLALPAGAVAAEPREYELVSPADKNGTDVQNASTVADNGNAVSWFSLGAYAGTRGADAEVPYAARRGDSGWATRAFAPAFGPDAPPDNNSVLGASIFSSSYDRMLFISNGSFAAADHDPSPPFGVGNTDIYSIDEGGAVTWLSAPTNGSSTATIPAELVGTSRDVRTVFLQTSERLTDDAPDDGSVQLYRWRDGVVQAVGRTPAGAVSGGGSWLGANASQPETGYGQTGDVADSQAVSRDGTRFVYGGYESGAGQLFLHRDGQAPIRISSSRVSGSVGAPATIDVSFLGATGDLHHIWFRSFDQLTDDAPSVGGDYRYDTETGDLSFSNVDDTLENPFALGGLVKASQDGSRVFFVSHAVLAPGADPAYPSLYVRDSGGIRYVASVSDSDSQLAANPFTATVNLAYTAAWLSDDGARLVYETAQGDPALNGTTQVYSYDALSGQPPTCVSCGFVAGSAPASATLKGPTETLRPTQRMLTSDGRSLFFMTASRLVPGDANGVTDVYEYTDGAARLISSGTSRNDSTLVGVGADGRDVFFTTRESLVPADDDGGLQDIYDARVGTVVTPEQEPQPCRGEDCRPPAAQRAAPSLPGTADFAGSEESAPPRESKATIAMAAIGKSTARALARGRSAVVTVRVNRGGLVTVSATARVGGLPAQVAKGTGRARKAGTVKIGLRLARPARRALARSGRLTLRITASTSAGDARASRTVVVRRAEKTRSLARRGARG